ncbi:putative protein kinase domain-containing protein [Phaeomoniella chlamydospora]|uniref:Protein kinase domain-containing protein n=1 Tax=Phaeomoniella chlamydospora TaxID=158046 RepID=A0A0G2DUX4_PHACM|nr:putative protein kinase domain-containing protein [Phaeomoniella chlamydospora]
MDVRIAGSPAEDFFSEPEPMKSPSRYGGFFHRIKNKFAGKDDTAGRERAPCPEDNIKKVGPRGIGIGPPRQQTFKRQNSERREKLEPIRPSPTERRAMSLGRKRAISVQPFPKQRQRTRSSPPPAPRYSLPTLERSNGKDQLSTWPSDDQAKVNAESPPRSPSRAESSEENANLAMMDEDLPPSIPYDELIQQELDSKWILNLSMHFRDKSDREKFFLTYAETPTKWRRVTVSCDYRNAEPGSLEMDLKELRYQRDKNLQIYESIRESLPEIEFYDTVTNLKLETTDGRLHVHVTEDVNEIIAYPPVEAIDHLLYDWDAPPHSPPLRTFRESEVEFDSHLSGFVYRVKVNGSQYIKKEIPGPDSVEEFLYEINALYALVASKSVIQLQAVILDDSGSLVKGLLINYAEKGAMVDIIFDSKETGGISWATRERWAEQIVTGLSEVHEAGFVQGDFTLSNVVVDAMDDASIIDINRRGCPVGWEPPELEKKIQSNQRISMYIGVKSDLFQLGMSLWALAMQDDEPERRERPLSTGDFPSDVPRWYKDIVESCLCKNPKDRMSAKELLKHFRSPVEERPGEDVNVTCELDGPEQAPNAEPHKLPTPPKSRADADSFDGDEMAAPPSQRYPTESDCSYIDVARGETTLGRHFADYEPHRGRRRSRDDELDLAEESDYEPQIVSVSPGADRRFDEVELDGHPYLVSHNSFLPEELEMLSQHMESRRESMDKSVVASDPRVSSETVGIRRDPISASLTEANIPRPTEILEEVLERPNRSPKASTPVLSALPQSGQGSTHSSPRTSSDHDLQGFGGHPDLEQHSPDEPAIDHST